MKCTNCGAEVSGKFCTNCGTPVQETPVANMPSVEPVPMAEPNMDFPTFDNMPLQSEAMPESTPASQEQPVSSYQSQPVSQQGNPYSAQTGNFGQSGAMPQSNNFNPYQNVQPNQNFGSNPYSQPADNSYSGEQYTIPNATTTVQGGKKKMSNGKIAAIIIAIVLGVLLLLGIVVGVMVWKFVKNVEKGIGEFSSGISSAVEEFNNENSDFKFEFNYDYDSDENSDVSTDEEYVYNGDLVEYIIEAESYTDDFGWQYVIHPEDNSKAILVGLNMYMAEDELTPNCTITVPESIDGKKIDEVYSLRIYDPEIENFNVKLVIPGHIKKVYDYALSYADDCLTEVVFEDGVESIGTEAIFRCEKIKKITVPESVKTIGDNALGFTYSEDFDVKLVDGVTVVTKKGSVADNYAKQNGIKVEYN